VKLEKALNQFRYTAIAAASSRAAVIPAVVSRRGKRQRGARRAAAARPLRCRLCRATSSCGSRRAERRWFSSRWRRYRQQGDAGERRRIGAAFRYPWLLRFYSKIPNGNGNNNMAASAGRVWGAGEAWAGPRRQPVIPDMNRPDGKKILEQISRETGGRFSRGLPQVAHRTRFTMP